MKDKWDKKLANEIRNLVVANEFLGESDEDITNKIVDLIRATRKHQREEWLKQLPSEKELFLEKDVIKIVSSWGCQGGLAQMLKVMRNLIKEKLEEK